MKTTLNKQTTLKRKKFQFSIFQVLNVLFFVLLVSSMVLPLLNTLALSFSSDMGSMVPEIILWPKEFSLNGYRTLFKYVKIFTPFMNNTIVTLVGTFLHVSLCLITAYALSKKTFKVAKYYLVFLMVTMMVPVQNIMIPLYLLYKDLHLINSLWAIILSGMITGYTVILLKNFFASIPDSLGESAIIDGASEWVLLYKIYIPLAKPGIATVILFQFVEKWNNYMESVLFLTDPKKYTLQTAIKSLVIDSDVSSSAAIVTKNAQMAGIVIAILPLLIVYPFLQRYFISGIMLGSTKG